MLINYLGKRGKILDIGGCFFGCRIGKAGGNIEAFKLIGSACIIAQRKFIGNFIFHGQFQLILYFLTLKISTCPFFITDIANK